MSKKAMAVIVTIVIIILLAVLTTFALNFFEQPSLDIAEQGLLHQTYLKDFLAETELTFVPVVRNDFAYYELHTADQQLTGFVFLGTEEGWAGPINLFVKTNVAGIIQCVQVWRHTETPIFVVGMDDFLATFADYEAEAELVWQEDVHGLTGATVTAEAIITAVYGSGRTAYQKEIFIREE